MTALRTVSLKWPASLLLKLSDPAAADAASSDKRRKPSDRVLKLVDEIMNLTLVEAADLCDLCQETLAERSGASNMGMMAPPMGMSMMGMGMPMMGAGAMPAGMPAAPAAAQAAPAAAAPEPAAEPAAKPAAPKKEEKAMYTLRLLGFDAAKKVSVIKEIRAITNLALKESKELVEAAPKIVSKTIKAEDKDALKAKLEAAGAQVAFE